jgi:hypothetical protein
MPTALDDGRRSPKKLLRSAGSLESADTKWQTR